MNEYDNDTLIQALEECLELMEQGASQEQVLQRYPLLAAELRPMLRAAQAAVNLVDSIQVPVGAQAHSRATFLNAAQAHKQHKHLLAFTRPRQQQAQPKPFLLNLAQAALILLVVFAIGSATAAGVSARSLPGDVLYPVKLITEQTQLLFTNNPQERIKLEQSFDEERVDEIQTLTTRERTTKVDFAGTLESSGTDRWQVGGVRLVINEQNEIKDYLESGLYLDITGELQSDGSVQVTQMRPREYEMKGKIESLAPTEWVVRSVLVRLTNSTIIKGSPRIGLEAEVKGYLLANGGLQANQIKIKEQKSGGKTQEATQEEIEPVDGTLEPSRTSRPERTHTETEEPGKTPEPSKTPGPEKTDEPEVTQTHETETLDTPRPTETPKPTGDD